VSVSANIFCELTAGGKLCPKTRLARALKSSIFIGQYQHNRSKEIMFHKKQSAIRKSEKRAINQMKLWDGGVEVNTGLAPIQDVRFLCAAINYPYMFENALGDLTIERHWSAAFTLTCMEIDEFLGRNKRGFCWRQLDVENGQPHWYWSLGSDHDHQVLVTDLTTQPSVVIVKSELDPKDEVRNAIRVLVELGMRQAGFFSQEASNSGALQ
jgi:hypothetical protein